MRRLAIALGLVAAVPFGAENSDQALSLATVLERAGERVERYFARAQSIVCLEVAHLQPLTSALTSDGFGRTVESELRLSWEGAKDGKPSAEAQTLRQLLKVNGQKPRPNDSNNCTTPEQQTQEPQLLSLLLPSQRAEYEFALAGQGSSDRRAAIMIDYRLLKKASAEASLIEGRDDCLTVNIDGGTRGRVWIDARTYDVLRLDQGLSAMVEIPLPRQAKRRASSPTNWMMERWDMSIRFKPVTFQDPEETLMLPASQSSLRITRGAGAQRLRTRTDYKNYKRFLTGGRVVG